MCEPVTAAMASVSASTMMATSLAVSAASAGLNYMAQSQQASAQAEYQQKAGEAAAQNALMQQEDLNERDLQEQEAAGLRLRQGSMKARKAQATAKATSESSGLSFDALMADYDRQESGYRQAQLKQLGWTQDQIDRQRESVVAGGQSKANQYASKPINSPSIGMSLANFGADALGTVQSFQTKDPLTGKYTI